jgi:hypothetical protein
MKTMLELLISLQRAEQILRAFRPVWASINALGRTMCEATPRFGA